MTETPSSNLAAYDPAVASRIKSLNPRARARYEVMAAGWREEWGIEREAREEVSTRALLWRWMTSVAEGVVLFGGIGLAVIFCAAVFAGACGTVVGVFVALVRAGWRAGASL